MLQVRVRPGGEDKIRNFFPWVYKSEIAGYSRKPIKGEHVVIRDAGGHFLGYGYINPTTNISIRVLSFNKAEKITKDLLYKRVEDAYNYRRRLSINSNAYRLVHSEGDLLPGLIADVYDKYVVVEFTTYGMFLMRDWVIQAIQDILRPEGIYEKTNEHIQKVEGFRSVEGVIWGHVPEEVKIWEHDLEFWINIPQGQKTGFFLDQRGARRFIRQLVKEGDRCLDVFCHTGGFAISMKKAGAGEVIGVDSSELALHMASKNAELNQISGIKWVESDAFDFLKEMHKSGEKFDIVVIDPPSFAKNKAAVESAMRGYKELLIRALHITKPGGYIAVYSCSFHIDLDHLMKAVLLASHDVRKQVRVIGISFQDLDHPWLLQMPNTMYLKGLYLEVV